MISSLALVDPALAPAGFPAAVGGSLDPDSLLAAYRLGYFPLPTDQAEVTQINHACYADLVADGRVALLPAAGGRSPYSITWWHPPDRPVIRCGDVHLHTSLRRELRNKHHWTTSANRAFASVVRECASQRRRWLTAELTASLLALHDAGWAHSAEVWDDGALIGGVFGIGAGTVLSVDSTFHRRPGAGRVALAELQERLAGSSVTLLDVQVPSDYATAVGGRLISRAVFVAELTRLPPLPIRLDTCLGQASRLAPAGQRNPRRSGGE